MELKYSRNGNDYAVDSAELPEAAISYLLQYGWAQSLQDSIAGREKKVRDELATDSPDMAPDEVRQAVLDDLHGTMMKRMDAIVAGTIGVRVTSERDELTGIARDIVRKQLAKKGVKLNMKNESDKAKFDGFVKTLLTEHRDVVIAEYNRRKELDIDLDIG